MKCTTCGATLKPLFTGTYCPNEQCGKETIQVPDPWGLIWRVRSSQGRANFTIAPSFTSAQSLFGTMRVFGTCDHRRRYEGPKPKGEHYCYDCGTLV